MDYHILGLNAVKILISNTRNIKTLIATLQSNDVNVESNYIKAFVKIITNSSDNSEVIVHSMPSSTIIPESKMSSQFREYTK